MSSIKRRLKRGRNKKQTAEITLWRDEPSSAMADPGRCRHCGRAIEVTFHNRQPDKSAGSS